MTFTDSQLYAAILLSLASNPILVNAEVYDPVSVARGNPTLVKINKYKLFGGLELLEPGLTLAVYPSHSSYSQMASTIDHNANTKSIEVYVSNKNSFIENRDIYRVIIQLSYLDPTFDYTREYRAVYKEFNSDVNPEWGDRITMYNNDRIIERTLNPETRDYFYRPGFNVEYALSVSIMPGEEILRQYTYYIRKALSTMSVLQPYCVRAPNLMWVDYPTTSPLRQTGENLVFHTCLMCVEFDVFNQFDARPKRLSA